MKALVQFFAISILLGTSILSSCTDEITSDKSVPSNNNEYAEMTNTEIKKEFGAALAKVLAESAPVRELIKKEALKMIDYDYDVLYMMVKDVVLKDKTTLEELMMKYIDQDFLNSLEKQLPNLTIYVPELSFVPFSAELWNIDDVIPQVAIRISGENGVPVVNSDGIEDIIRNLPEFPVVVIKENERIIANDLTKSSDKNKLLYSTKSNTKFSFVDKVFDNLNGSDTSNEQKQLGLKAYTDIKPVPDNIKKASDAYEIYRNNDGWQRDYVYYNISPASPEGPFNNNYKECLLTFELLGNADGVARKISQGDAGDPTINKFFDWTDGEFEFLVKIYLGSKSLIGSELKTFFRARPSDLFHVSNGTTTGRDRVPYLNLHKMNLNLPLFEWNLENYASSVKLTIEEVDPSQVIKNSTTTSVEFASNFKYSASFGTKVKTGLEFGTSEKQLRSVVYEVTTNVGNDELGDVPINFSDEIIIAKDTGRVSTGGIGVALKYNPKYYTGWYKIEVAPLKMY